MKVLANVYNREPPTRRPLRIYSSDPMAGRLAGNRISIDVPYEPLKVGPVGSQVAVVDFDTEHQCYYAPVDLDESDILMQGGLEPSESDPRFHQQMVYAVAMRVIENFERALGRPLSLRRRGRPLRLLPHAFYGANAYYSRALHAVLFGYFRADRENPGENLPDQNVYTCLSHDIIAHEVTHAVVHRLRRHFLLPTNSDVLAFHEGFSDIVALFQHFSYESILKEHIQVSRTDLRTRELLVSLAQQFGQARGMGRALRSALDDEKRRKTLRDGVIEPHERGSILVAAVFDAFFTVYQRRITDLIRIATGGRGTLPDQDLHPDLVNRIAAEASSTAQAVLTMCIRAFDYLAPVDITFGDYLRALVTADYELNPVDTFGLRAAMVDAFRLRGIYPHGVVSLAEESLLWGCPPGLEKVPVQYLGDILMQSVRTFQRGRSEEEMPEEPTDDEDRVRDYPKQLGDYARRNADSLGFVRQRGLPNQIGVDGFHWVFRVGRNNRLIIELVIQYSQITAGGTTSNGGLQSWSGTTVVAAADGTVRYVIAKPTKVKDAFPAEIRRQAEERKDRQRAYIELCDQRDPRLAWGDQGYRDNRMAMRMNLAHLHEG
jgi:hypothetical protein